MGYPDGQLCNDQLALVSLPREDNDRHPGGLQAEICLALLVRTVRIKRAPWRLTSALP
jgi:hypothetical protein